MSESGSRWEPGSEPEAQTESASVSASGPGQPGVAEDPGPTAGGETAPSGSRPEPEPQSARRGLLAGTPVKLAAAGLVLFLGGGAGGYSLALALARTGPTGFVPTGFQIEFNPRAFGDGDGGRGFDRPFGQTSPFGSGGGTQQAPTQGTTT